MLPRIPVYTSSARKREAPSGTPRPPAQCNSPTRLSRARGAPMSAIGRSVGIKSCPWSLLLRAFRLLAARESILPTNTFAPPGCLLPKAQNPSGKHTPLLPPAQSPRLHLTLTLDAMGLIVCLYCTVVCQPPRHPTSPNSFSVSSNVKKAPGPLRATCTTTC